MLRNVLLTALLLATIPLAQAADHGIYLGAGYAYSEYGLDDPTDAPEFDDEDHGFKLIAGWRPIDNFGVEVNYVDHGNATVPAGIACIALFQAPCPDTTRLSADTLSAFAVGYIDLPALDLFAKAGVTNWGFDGRTPGLPGFNANETGTDFAWGVGVQVRFWSLAARLEYETFPIVEDEELGTISLSLTYTFL